MSDFSLPEVARLAGLPPDRVLDLVQAGILNPAPAGDEGRFSFRDLVLCRSARRLIESEVPAGRLAKLLGGVKARLPDEAPLSGVALDADGPRVLARDGGVTWEVETGQVCFGFEAPVLLPPSPVVELGSVSTTELIGVEDGPDGLTMTAGEWFDLGLELEAKHPEQARDAYRRALELAPLDRESRLNIARLLRLSGLVESAEAQYRLAADLHPDDPRVVHDLGLLLESQARWWDAVAAYEQAVERASRSPDVYRRLAALYERLGDETQAIRALVQYRSLTDPSAD